MLSLIDVTVGYTRSDVLHGVTVDVPTGNTLPDAGRQLTDGIGSTASDAVGIA